MKTFEQLREELESIKEISTSLLKRYTKKAGASGRSVSAAGYDKAHGYAKVAPTGGASAADHAKAKAVAHSIAKAHKNLKVSSHGNEHFIHHKNDEDGHEHVRVTHASKGKVQVTHEYCTAGSGKKTLSHAAAVKHGHSIVTSQK